MVHCHAPRVRRPHSGMRMEPDGNDYSSPYSHRTVGGRVTDSSQWATPDEGALEDNRPSIRDVVWAC